MSAKIFFERSISVFLIICLILSNMIIESANGKEIISTEVAIDEGIGQEDSLILNGVTTDDEIMVARTDGPEITTNTAIDYDSLPETTTDSAIDYDSLIDVEQYIMENYMEMTEEDLEEIVWPEIELNELEEDDWDLKLESEVGEKHDKEIRAYGYVWSYDFEDPTVTNNQGFVELEQGEPRRRFEHLFEPNEKVYVRAFEVYDNYVAYSNQRQFEPKATRKTTSASIYMEELSDDRIFTKASDDSSVNGTTYFKDSGDDFDKLIIAVLTYGSLSLDIDVDTVPEETSHLVLRGCFGGFAYVYVNDQSVGFVGSSTSKEYYAMDIPTAYLEEGTNTIEVYVYGAAWAKVDAISVVIDGGDSSNGEISDINFEDWSMSYVLEDDDYYYYVDLYANATTDSVDTDMDLELVNSIGLSGLNHTSSSEYNSLDESSDTYSYSITLPDDEDDSYDFSETGNWNLFSMIVDDKEVINIDSKGFYYEESEGIRNFDMDFCQDVDDYTNGTVNIITEVDDLFNNPFSYIECPDGTIVYDYDTTYEVSSNDDYTFIIAEPDGTETEYIHEVTNIDTTVPTIELSGDDTITIIEENTYVDMGVVMSDELSGLASDEATIDYGDLDTDNPSPGTYTVTCAIYDMAGNSNSTTREVVVKNKPLEVNTDSITKSSTEATLSGSIAYYGEEELSIRGLVWGLTSNPTVDSYSGISYWEGNITNKDTFSRTLTLDDLYDNVTYNVRAFVETVSGSVTYGDNMTFDSSDKIYGSYELSSTSYSVSKGDSVTVYITRNDGSDGEDIVYYRTVNGSAVSGTQYTSNSSSVTFSDGDDATKSVTISTSDYDTWEEDNRAFYFEIYEVDGDGSIGSDDIATITFTDDTDSITSISSGSWVTKWTYSGFNSESNTTVYYPDSDGQSLSDYDYWLDYATSFLGRGYGDVNTNYADVRFKFQRYTTSWVDSGYEYISSGDGWYYTSSGNTIIDASKVRLKIEVKNAGGWSDDGGVDDPEIQLKITDSTSPSIDSYYSVDGDYAEGDSVYISVQFSEVVTGSNLADVSMKIQLYDEDGNTVTEAADYVTGNVTDTLVFKFTVPTDCYNTKLYTTGFNNGSNIEDLVGNSFSGSSTSITINSNVNIASTGHEITFSPNGNTTESTSHSTTVTVEASDSAPADITSTEYLWSTETDTQVSGFTSFSSGDTLTIEGVTGDYYLHIQSEDDYGNQSYEVSNYFSLDNTDPTFSLSASTTDWTNNDVTLTIDDLSDDATINTRQYLEGYYSIEDFDTDSGISFTGDSFTVDSNDIYSVYLETSTGIEYVNNITIDNIDMEVPVVEIDTDGSDGDIYYTAETIVTAYDEGDSELATLQYAWSDSDTKPSSDWTDFSSGDELETSDSGTWYLHIDAIDNAGNETYVCSESFIVDTTEPTITATATNPDTWTNEEVDIDVYAYKDNLNYVMLPDISTVDAESVDDLMVVDTTYTVDSNGYYSFIAVDDSGNTAEANVNITKIDTDAPNITVERSRDDWTEGPITLTISADDDASIIYDDEGDFLEYGGVGGITIKKIDSDSFEDYSESFTYEVSENSTYQITAKDSLDNSTTRDIVISNIDTAYPYVDSDNTDYGAKNTTIEVNLTYSDAEMGTVDSQEYSIETSTTSPTSYDEYDGSTISFDSEGEYYIHYRATDEVGHETTGYYGPYTYSSSEPSITIEASDAEDYMQSHEATITVEYNDYSEGTINYQWSSSSDTPTTGWDNSINSGSSVTREGDNGDLYLHVRVISDSNYFYGSRVFKFDNTAPTITVVGDNPMTLTYGDTYVEEGVTYEDTYDLWPTYTAPSLSDVDNNELGSYELTYTVVDDAGNEATATRTVNVEDITSPTITDVSFSGDEDNTITFNNETFESAYSDDLTDIASIEIESLPSNGTLQLDSVDISVGQNISIDEIDYISYVPSSDWNGSDSLTYSAYDSYSNESDTGTINITITAINDNPVANDDAVSVDEDSYVIIDVRIDDTDVETETNSLTVDSVTQPSDGIVVNNNDGTVTYTPDENFNGADEFTYTIKDENDGTDTGTVTVTVDAINDSPTSPSELSVDSSSPYYGGESVLISWSGASDIDGDSISYELDYYDGSSWNNIDTDISETSISFIIPSINTEEGKLRIQSYDGNLWSSDYYESESFTIDSVNPEVAASISSNDWTNADYTVDLTYSDTLGIDSIYYEVSQSTTTPSTYDDYSDESEDVLSVVKTITINDEGINYIHYKIVDVAGNTVTGNYGDYKLDKTEPDDFIVTATADSSTEITINGTTTDSTTNSDDVSELQTNSYNYSIDDVYNNSYESDGNYTFESLTPNKQYTFKMKAIDNAGNIRETAEVNKYTKVEDPTSIICTSYSKYSLNISITASENNSVEPAYKVWLTLKDGTAIVTTSDYSTETSRSFTSLSEDTDYDVWVQTRNEDLEENEAINLGTYKTNKGPELVISNQTENQYVMSGETITLSGTVTDSDNESLTVSMTIDEVEKSVEVSETENGASWELTYDVDSDDIAESNYTGVTIMAEDTHGDTVSATYTGDLIVDKTVPNAPSIDANESWSSNDSERVTIVDNGDSGDYSSGVATVEYSLSGAKSTNDYTTYTDEFEITEEGITIITARVVDNAGNVSDETTKTVYIDRTNPVVNPTAVDGTIFTNGYSNETVDWTNAAYTVEMTYTDEVGIDSIYYEVSQSVTTPSDFDDYSDEAVSESVDVLSVVKNVDVDDEGINYIHYKIVDLAGNTVTGHYGPYKLDETEPDDFTVTATADSSMEITINGTTSDCTTNSDDVSALQTNSYNYSIDGVYNESYESDGNYTYESLTPNKEYTFKMKAIDNAGNVRETAEVSKYTKVEDPTSVICTSYTKNSLTISIVASESNSVQPAYKVWLTLEGDTVAVTTNDYSTETSRSFTSLSEDTDYDVWVQTRNEDLEENEAVNLGTYKTNKEAELEIADSDVNLYVMSGDTITLTGTVTDMDNESVTVSGTIDNVTKSVEVSETETGAAWSLTYDVDDIAESNYTGVSIIAEDSHGDRASVSYTGDIIVDKTMPNAPSITANESWSSEDSEGVTITDNGDLGNPDSGVASIEYSLSGAVTTEDFITYDQSFGITEEGTTTITARVIDNAGNISSESSKTVYIDRTNPEVSPTSVDGTVFTNDYLNEAVDWTNADYMIEMTYTDEVGIDSIYYEVSQDTTTPGSYTDYSDEDVSGNEDSNEDTSTSETSSDSIDETDSDNSYVLSVAKTIDINDEGINYIHYKIVDMAGNSSTGYYGPYKLDKTSPDTFDTTAVADSGTEITISGTTIDTTTNSSITISELQTNAYNYSIDDVYNESYESDGSYTFSSLTPNTAYTFKMKSIDNAGNITETSEVNKYTKAEDPSDVACSSYTKNTLDLSLVVSEENGVQPSYKVWLTLEDDTNAFSTSNYSTSSAIYFIGLIEDTDYDIWVQTRNEDLEENEAVKLGTYKTNKEPELEITDSDVNLYVMSGDTITLTGTVTDTDIESVTVSGTIDDVTKFVEVSETENGATWSLTYDVDDITEGNYTGVIISAEDSHGDSISVSYTGDIIVDKTMPNAPSITANESWSSEDSETVSITDNGDLGNPGSGVASIEYSLSGSETTDGYTTYDQSFEITEEGTTTITARVIDNAGNISSESSNTVYIDRTNPEASPASIDGTVFTNDYSNETVDWTNADYTIEMTYTDEVGIDSIYYEVSQDTTTPKSYTDYSDEAVSQDTTNDDTTGSSDEINDDDSQDTTDNSEETASTVEYVTTVAKTIDIKDEGINYIHYKIVDMAGNISTGYYGPYKLDKTVPDTFNVTTVADSSTEITISGTTIDITTNSSITISELQENAYNYSIDDVYNGSYELDGSYTFSSLTPNTVYTFKMKAIDNAGNVEETSEVNKYTKAENPSDVTRSSYTKNTLDLSLEVSEENGVQPSYKVWLTLEGDTSAVSTNNYSTSSAIYFADLLEDINYDVWVQTRNEDLEENEAVKLGTYKTNKEPELEIIDSDVNLYVMLDETITLSGTVTDTDNESLTVSGTIDGVTKPSEVSETENGAVWSLTYDVDDIAEGNYTGVTISAEDSHGDYITASYTGDIIVDKTVPNAPSITANESWSSEESESVSITDNGDLGNPASGVERIEYSLSGEETTEDFITYDQSFEITEEGITTITARVIDKAGNISSESSKTVYIDRTNPEVTPTSVDGTVFTSDYSNETVDWTNADYTIEMTYTDEVGIDSIYYEVSQDTTTPESYTNYSDEAVSQDTTESSDETIDEGDSKDTTGNSEETASTVEYVTTVAKTIDISDEGINYIHYKIVDIAGNSSASYYGPYKIDKTSPVNFDVVVGAIAENRITISGTTTDSTSSSGNSVSGLQTDAYNYSIDGIYNESYESDGSYTFSDLDSDTEYSFTMKAIDIAGNTVETNAVIVSTDEEDDKDTEDVVENTDESDDANSYDWQVSITDDETVYVEVDISDNSDSENDTSSQEENEEEASDYIAVTLSTDDDVIIVALTAEDVKEMEESNVELVIENEVASYTIPAEEMYIDTVVSEFGEEVNMEEVEVQIEITVLSDEEIAEIEEELGNDYEIVGEAVSFEISCVYNDEKVEISSFNTYISRQINISDEVDSGSITTAIVIKEDGSTYPVPTKVVVVDGKYYAEINSVTNSNYVLISNDANYEDIEGHWAKEAIEDLGDRTILEEISDDKFNPDIFITRDDFITTVVRALGLKVDDVENQFKDVDSGDEHYKYINTAYEYQLLKGYEDGNAYSNNVITREEAMTIISRSMALTGLCNSINENDTIGLLDNYSDVEQISDWALDSVEDCISTQIVFGRDGKTLSPKDNITRAEAIVMIRRLLKQSDLI